MATPLKPIDGSSLIKAAGYDLATQTLAVQFHSGQVYHYAGVPPEKYEAMHKADSIGRYFGAEIRGKHAHELVAEPHHHGSPA